MSLAKSIAPALIAGISASQVFADTAILTVSNYNGIFTSSHEANTREKCLSLAYGATGGYGAIASVSCHLDSEESPIYYICGSNSSANMPGDIRGKCVERKGPLLQP